MESVNLQNPDFLALDDAYRGLPRLQHINVQTRQLGQVLGDMERIGFVAIQIVEMDESSGSYTIRASKGKHGPCNFKGDTACYSGAALAALDDDLHLLPRDKYVAVCEKTRAILELTDYEDVVTIRNQGNGHIAGDVAESAKLDIESAAALVYDQVKSLPVEHADRQMLFYPGPFRLLILHDGSVARRGTWNSVPVNTQARLRGKDRMISDGAAPRAETRFLQELYPEKGAAGLLGEWDTLQQATVEYATDFDCLKQVREPLRSRLLRLIAEERKYFLLVGNEASDTYGCCPSEEVTEANKLVKGGILDAFSEPVTGDACPVTLYAFRNEMTLSEDGLTGEPDAAFRDEVKAHLKGMSYSRVHLVIKWILIAFVAVSLLLGMRNCYQQQFGDAVTQVTMQRINPENKFQAVLVLFHNQKRCYQCLEMEKLSHDLFDKKYGETDDTRPVGFTTLVIDDPASVDLVDQFGIFAATLVLIDYSDPGKPVGKVLKKAPELYHDPAAFSAYLESELETYID